jgi:type I restriction enzyme S subunit
VSGWRSKALGEVCDVIGGGTPPKDRPEFYTGNIPWATVRDMHSEVITSTEFKITPLAVESSATNIIPKNNVIIATRVGLGKVCLLREDTAINQDLRAIIPRDTRHLCVPFLFWWLKSVAHLIVAEGTGATVQGVKLPFIKSLPIPLPPIAEQQRIVAVLDETFAGLATAAANAEKNLENTGELFDSYLSFIVNKSGVTWEKKRLPEVAREFGRGKSKHRPRNDPKLYGGPYPFVQTGDISNADHWLTDYTQTYSALGLAQSRLWPKGTVCIAIVGATVGETAILEFDACFPDSVIGIIVDERIADTEYVEYLLQAFKTVLKAKGKGTARDNINLGTFENQLFPFPALKEQRGIVDRLNEMATRKRELEDTYSKRLAAISELRQSILQKAFSGELISQPSQVIKEAAE